MHSRLLRKGRELSLKEMPLLMAIAGNEIRDFGYTVALDDGSSRELFGNAVPLLDESGKVRGAVGAFIDVTEFKRTEEEFLRSEKLASLGRLAGGIAHDFNNLLMIIQSYTELLQNGLPANDGLRRNTEAILKAADHAANLTRQMLAFGRKQLFFPVVLDLKTLIDETAWMLKQILGEDIEFSSQRGGVALGD